MRSGAWTSLGTACACRRQCARRIGGRSLRGHYRAQQAALRLAVQTDSGRSTQPARVAGPVGSGPRRIVQIGHEGAVARGLSRGSAPPKTVVAALAKVAVDGASSVSSGSMVFPWQL